MSYVFTNMFNIGMLENFYKYICPNFSLGLQKDANCQHTYFGGTKKGEWPGIFLPCRRCTLKGHKKSGQVAVLVCTLCKSFEKIWNIHTYRPHAPYLAIKNFYIFDGKKKCFFSDNLISSHWASPFLALERGRLYSEASRAFESIQPNFQWLEHFFFNRQKVLLSIP